jgi:hypothetical protein
MGARAMLRWRIDSATLSWQCVRSSIGRNTSYG